MGENTNKEISKSAAKRTAVRKEVAAKKRKKAIIIIAVVAVIALIAGLIIYKVADRAYFNAHKTVASYDYSEGLTEDGKIAGLNVADYVTAPDYKNITVDGSNLAYSDEKVDADIEAIRKNAETLVTDSSVEAKSGDKVSIVYTGYMDGEAFEGGASSEDGATVTLGSGSLIDDFEDQIVGHKVGDSFTVEVTFPDQYPNQPLYQGKDASFEVTLKGVYVMPEFDDAYVAENYSKDASTVAEYREYLKKTNYQKNLENALATWIGDNAKAKKYDKKYLNIIKSQTRGSDESYYQYMLTMYAMYGATPPTDFWDYKGTTERKYEKELTKEAKESFAIYLTYQYIFETEGLTITDEFYQDEVISLYLGDTYEDAAAVETAYGKPALMQLAIQKSVLKYLATIANVQ